MDTHYLHFSIDYHASKHGWLPCYLTCDATTYRINASAAMPPMRNLLDFLRRISLQRLPARFFLDEEGRGPHFEAWPLVDPTLGDSPDFHLRILYEANDIFTKQISADGDFNMEFNTYYLLWVDGVFSREAVVEVFLAALRDFVLYSKHQPSWEISLADLAAFEHLRERAIPPRSDITRAEPLDVIITRWQDDEEARGSQYIELRMWDMLLDGWNADDSDPLWPGWVALLEHALSGQPYSFDFINLRFLRIDRDMVADGSIDPAQLGPPWSTRVCISPLAVDGHARLQIYETDDRYHDQLHVDEVINAAQVARIFLKELDDLLAEGYRAYPDDDGQVYDLNNLPLARLRALLG